MNIEKFRSAREMFTKKQMPDESVDSYANRTQKLANCIDASDETLRYAFVSGLRPKIASFVLSKEPESMNKALDAARIAEMSLGEAYEAENAELTGQLTEIRRELKKMADRYDSITPSAPIQTDRARSPARRVTFEGGREETRRSRPSSPSYGQSQDRPYAYQASPNFGSRPTMTRGRGRARMNGYRPFGRGARGTPQFNGQWRNDNLTNQQYSPQYTLITGQAGNARRNCPKCEMQPHANILMCPANNRMCLSCGRYGHHSRVCAQARIQQA